MARSWKGVAVGVVETLARNRRDSRLVIPFLVIGQMCGCLGDLQKMSRAGS